MKRTHVHVDETTVEGFWISTVRLPCVHPLIKGAEMTMEGWYETMIFDESTGLDVGYQKRYETEAEAIEGHAEAVSFVKEGKDWTEL